MARNTHIWIPNAEECYLIAKIVSTAGDKIKVKLGRDGAGAAKSVDPASCLPIEDINNIDNLEEDLVQMECVHEASILHNLRARHMEDHIYTALGRPVVRSLLSFIPHSFSTAASDRSLMISTALLLCVCVAASSSR